MDAQSSKKDLGTSPSDAGVVALSYITTTSWGCADFRLFRNVWGTGRARPL